MSEHLHELLKKNLKVFFKPVYSFLLQPEILEISISNFDEIWLKTETGIERAEESFKEEKLSVAIRNLLQLFGAELSSSQPHVRLMAPEGLQVDLWHTGKDSFPLLIFKKAAKVASISLNGLSREGVLSKVAQFFLQGLLDSRQTILITGTPATLRHRFFRALLRELPEQDRKLFMPLDSKPLQLSFALQLEHPAAKKQGLPPERLGVFQNLQPARWLIEDLADSDTSAILELLTRGFSGSILSLEAGDARKALHRLEFQMARNSSLPIELIRNRVALSFPWILTIDALPSGEMYISSIDEVLPHISPRGYELRQTFAFHAHHRAEGWFRSLQTTGHVPSCLSSFHIAGFHALQEQDFESEIDATIFRHGRRSKRDFLAAAQQLMSPGDKEPALEDLSEEIQKVSKPLSSIRKRLRAEEMENVQEQLEEAVAGKPILRAPLSQETLLPEENTFEQGPKVSSETGSGASTPVAEPPQVVNTAAPPGQQDWPGASSTSTGSFVFVQAVKAENEEMNRLLDEDREHTESDTLVKGKAVLWKEATNNNIHTAETAIRRASDIVPSPQNVRPASDVLSMSDMIPEDELQKVRRELRGTFTRDPSVNDTRLGESPRVRFPSSDEEEELPTLKSPPAPVPPPVPVVRAVEPDETTALPGVGYGERRQAGQGVPFERSVATTPPQEDTAIPQRNQKQDRAVVVRRGVRQTSSYYVDELEPGDRTYVRARTPERVQQAPIIPSVLTDPDKKNG